MKCKSLTYAINISFLKKEIFHSPVSCNFQIFTYFCKILQQFDSRLPSGFLDVYGGTFISTHHACFFFPLRFYFHLYTCKASISKWKTGGLRGMLSLQPRWGRITYVTECSFPLLLCWILKSFLNSQCICFISLILWLIISSSKSLFLSRSWFCSVYCAVTYSMVVSLGSRLSSFYRYVAKRRKWPRGDT